jgi:hypothetical protein
VCDQEVHGVRPVSFVFLLLLTACTVRADTFARNDAHSIEGFSFAAPELNARDSDEPDPCPGGYARASLADVLRDGTHDLFCY